MASKQNWIKVILKIVKMLMEYDMEVQAMVTFVISVVTFTVPNSKFFVKVFTDFPSSMRSVMSRWSWKGVTSLMVVGW